MIDPLLIINSSINKLLSYDNQTLELLSQMEGRSLCWDVEGYSLMIVMKVYQGQLCLDDKLQKCQVHLKASPKELASLWQQHQKDVEPDLNIQGNPLALQDFVKLFKQFEVDWEDILQPYINPLLIQIISRTINSLKRKFNPT